MELPKIEIPRLKTAYGYANARVHGMKGLLLKREQYLELVNLSSVDGMIEYLQRTHYKTYLLDAALNFSGSLIIEQASGNHYSKIASKIKKISPKGDEKVVDALLMSWNLANLKIVLNCRSTTNDFKEALAKIVPAGSLSVSDLESIYNAETNELINEIKKTDFGSDLFDFGMSLLSTKERHDFQTTTDVSKIKTILDKYSALIMEQYLSPHLGNKEVQMVHKLLKKQTTTKNIIIIERLKSTGVKTDEIPHYLIKGGYLGKSEIAKIISAQNLSDLFPIIKKYFTKFNPENVNSIVDLEIELEKALSAEKSKMFNKSILSIGVLLGFLLLKEEEMNNLRKIAKAKEFGMEKEKVLKTLIISK